MLDNNAIKSALLKLPIGFLIYAFWITTIYAISTYEVYTGESPEIVALRPLTLLLERDFSAWLLFIASEGIAFYCFVTKEIKVI